MNYYQHHIGDFNNATRHLTRVERSIYREMIDIYYDTELPLTLDFAILCRKLMARSEEERTAVEQLLNEFFTKTASGWFHSRCDEEITEYRKATSAKSLAGKASAAKRAEEKQKRIDELNKTSASNQQNKVDVQHNSTDVQQVLDSVCSSVQLTSNQEPVTNNHKPLNPALTTFVESDSEVGANKENERWVPNSVALSIAMRKHKIKCQPADPRLIELAAQGITPETAEAACIEALASKPDGVGIGYVCAILTRWAEDSKRIKVSGAEAPKKTSAWWASDESILAEGRKHKLQPYAGERMPSFKTRIEAAIEKANSGEAPATSPPVAPVARPPELPVEKETGRDMSAEAVAKRREALDAARNLPNKKLKDGDDDEKVAA